MINKLAQITLKSIIKKNNIHRQKQFLSWDKIQKIALIISKDGSLNKSALDKFIVDSQKYVEVFLIELNVKEPSFSDYKCFTKKDKTILNLPKNAVLNELSGKNFDLVINASHNSLLFAAAITANLNAPIKCGSTNEFNGVELVIQKSVPFSLISYLNDVIKYLKMIKT